jgi:hypothetical protein
MRKDIFSVLGQWAKENNNADRYQPEDGIDTMARVQAQAFIAEASTDHGLSETELRNVHGEIVGYLAGWIREANDAEAWSKRTTHKASGVRT